MHDINIGFRTLFFIPEKNRFNFEQDIGFTQSEQFSAGIGSLGRRHKKLAEIIIFL